jgi:hypothetical protein
MASKGGGDGDADHCRGEQIGITVASGCYPFCYPAPCDELGQETKAEPELAVFSGR